MERDDHEVKKNEAPKSSEQMFEETITYTIDNTDINRSLKPEEAKVLSMTHLNAITDSFENASKLYSQVLPKEVVEFLKKETNSFLNGFQKLSNGLKNQIYWRMVETYLRNVSGYLTHFTKHLKMYLDLMDTHEKKNNKADATKERILVKKTFIILNSVLSEFTNSFDGFKLIPEDDYFLLNSDNADYKMMSKLIERVETDSRLECINGLKHIENKVLGLLATMSKEAQRLPKTNEDIDAVINTLITKSVAIKGTFPIEYKSKIDHKCRDKCDDLSISFIKRMVHFSKNPKKAAVDGRFSIAQGDYEILRKLFHFVEKGIIKFLRKWTEYDAINNNIKIYISDKLLDRIFDKSKTTVMKLKTHKVELTIDELYGETFVKVDPSGCKVRFFSDHKFKRLSSNLGKRIPKTTIPMKNPPVASIDSNTELKFTSEFTPEKPWLEGEEERKHFDTIMVYIHGGGFAAMTSSSHQNFLRKWSKDLKIPIFSIDYRLSPAVKYPELPNDVIRSYVWVLAFLSEVLKVNPSKIIIAGDSAGGNLACTLTTWCIENKVRGPTKLMLHYPGADLNQNKFTLSLFYAFTDFLLSYSGLRMSIAYYVPDSANLQSDYYLVPLATPLAILSQYPQTDLLICERDPLSDDDLRLAYRFYQAILTTANQPNRDKMKENSVLAQISNNREQQSTEVDLEFVKKKLNVLYFPHLCHGLLNFAKKNKDGIKQALVFEQRASKLIRAHMEAKQYGN